MAADETVKLSILRYDPDKDEKPRFQDYEIPFADRNMVVLDALNYIKGHVDGSVSYRWSCRMGICGSCGMLVNGQPKLTCNAYLRDYHPAVIRVEPLSNFPIIRDLVIDMEPFMEKLTAIKPWIIRKNERPLGAGEFRQSQDQADQYRQFSGCINCMLCYSACPVYAAEPDFIGPAATALAHRYNRDSRDQGKSKRLPVIASGEGVWECSYVGECSVVCPKGVDPAKAIQQVKWETSLGYVLPFGGDDE